MHFKACTALLVLASLTHFSASQTVTIFSLPAYKSALVCVRDCIYCMGVPCLDDLGQNLSCGYDPFQEACWCRSDFYAKATSYLSECVSFGCEGRTRDILSAVSMYQGYCAGKDTEPIPTVTEVETQAVSQTTTKLTELVEFTATVTDTAIETLRIGGTTTIFTGTATTRMSSLVTVVVYSTITTRLNDTTIGQLADEWRGPRGLQTGDKVAIAIGVVGGVIIIGAVMWIVVLQTKNSMMKQELDTYRSSMMQYGGVQTPVAQN